MAFSLAGMGDVLSKLDETVKKIEGDAARKALDEQGDALVASVVDSTPVLTGAAAGSVRKGDPGAKNELVVEAGGSEAPHFPIIEFGSIHVEPAAPVRRGLEERRPVFVSEVAESIRASVPELER